MRGDAAVPQPVEEVVLGTAALVAEPVGGPVDLVQIRVAGELQGLLVKRGEADRIDGAALREVERGAEVLHREAAALRRRDALRDRLRRLMAKVEQLRPTRREARRRRLAHHRHVKRDAGFRGAAGEQRRIADNEHRRLGKLRLLRQEPGGKLDADAGGVAHHERNSRHRVHVAVLSFFARREPPRGRPIRPPSCHARRASVNSGAHTQETIAGAWARRHVPPGLSRRGHHMSEPTGAETRKAVSAAVIGNVLEWYDFAVYAFVATIIAKKFFPARRRGHGAALDLPRLRARLRRPPARRHRHRPPRRHPRPQDRAAHHDLPDGGRHGADRPDADLRDDRRAGAAAPGRRAADAGLLGRRRMGRLDRLHRRVGAGRKARLVRQLPADERGGGPAARLGHRGAAQHRPRRRPRWRPGAGACRSCSAASSARSACGCGARSTRRRPTQGRGAAPTAPRPRTAAGCLRRAPSASPSCGRCASTSSSTTCRPGPGNT